jgi:predicted  nucleic acid-binding Zn-ribbon protein
MFSLFPRADESVTYVHSLREELKRLRAEAVQANADMEAAQRREEQARLELEDLREQLKSYRTAGGQVGQIDVGQSELHGAFGAVTEDTLWWRAVQALLNREIKLSLEHNAQPNLTAEQRHYNSGRLAQLLDFQDLLLKARMTAAGGEQNI